MAEPDSILGLSTSEACAEAAALPSLYGQLEYRADGDTHCPRGKQSTVGERTLPGARLGGLCGGF